VLNVHAPTEDKIDDIKDRFYEELEQVFDKLPKYHVNILLGDFNSKVGREDIFKPTIGNESSHEITNNNGVRVVNFATYKNLTVKSKIFPHRNIHKAWENIRGNIKTAKESLGYYELKKNKPWFDEGWSKLLEERKQAKLQWLQNPSEVNGDNLNNARREKSRNFRNKRANV
jgi:hypothetical protein